jgi:hypothetical protein
VQRIGAFVGRALRWVRPSLMTAEYELQDGDEVIATLRFHSSWGTLATAESADGCWTFKRVGFLQTSVTIRACGADAEIAIFKNSSWTGGGTLALPDGREYRANSNFWMTRFGFTTLDDQPLVEFQRIGGLLKLSSTVEIHAAAERIPELPWMVMLGWYLTVLLHRDASE